MNCKFCTQIPLYFILDEAAEEEYEIIIDDEEYTVYVIDSDENEEYTFDDETPFDVYTVDVSSFLFFK